MIYSVLPRCTPSIMMNRPCHWSCEEAFVVCGQESAPALTDSSPWAHARSLLASPPVRVPYPPHLEHPKRLCYPMHPTLKGDGCINLYSPLAPLDAIFLPQRPYTTTLLLHNGRIAIYSSSRWGPWVHRRYTLLGVYGVHGWVLYRRRSL